MPFQANVMRQGCQAVAASRGRPPTDGSGRDLLGRLRAHAESVRRQMAARRQNCARMGGPPPGRAGGW